MRSHLSTLRITGIDAHAGYALGQAEAFDATRLRQEALARILGVETRLHRVTVARGVEHVRG
jgi:hypothetical protein